MQHDYSFVYNRLLFRPLTNNTIEQMRVLRNKNRHCFVSETEVTKDDQEKWYEKYCNKENDYMFSLYTTDDVWVGVAGIYEIDINAKSAEFGRIMIDKSVTIEKGLGVDATQGLFNFATKELGLKKIVLEVFQDNIPAIKTYIRSGFMETGRAETLEDGRILLQMKKEI